MSGRDLPADDRNPFATCYVRPGALPYLFDPGQTAFDLIDRLRTHGWRGEIFGPHGSGKSTLLATLVPALRAAGCDVAHTALHDGQRRLSREFWKAAYAIQAPGVLVVDGYEQLGWLSRGQLRRVARHCGAGLLVTSHRPTGLPRLLETRATADRAWRVIECLVAGLQGVIDRADLALHLDKHGGNLREVLMELYDMWEERE